MSHLIITSNNTNVMIIAMTITTTIVVPAATGILESALKIK